MRIEVEWDLDGLTPEEAGVPETLEVPKHLADPDEITDYLSDTYGWCVIGWEEIQG